MPGAKLPEGNKRTHKRPTPLDWMKDLPLSLSFSKHLKTEPKWIECVAFNPSRIGITLAPKTKKAKFESFMHYQIAAIDIRKKGKSIFLPSLTKTRIIPTYPFQILGWSYQFSPTGRYFFSPSNVLVSSGSLGVYMSPPSRRVVTRIVESRTKKLPRRIIPGLVSGW